MCLSCLAFVVMTNLVSVALVRANLTSSAEAPVQALPLNAHDLILKPLKPLGKLGVPGKTGGITYLKLSSLT